MFYIFAITLLVFGITLIRMVYFNQEISIMWFGISTAAAFIGLAGFSITTLVERARSDRKLKTLL